MKNHLLNQLQLKNYINLLPASIVQNQFFLRLTFTERVID